MIDYYYEWVWHVISVDAIRFEGFVRAVPAVVIAVVVVVVLLLLSIIQVVAEASPAASSDR